MSKTIAAISTPPATGGISIVRISGPDAISVADRVFCSRSGEKLAQKKGYTALFGTVFSEGKELDTSIATVFRAPRSYTGEDVVELSCHGGIVVTRMLLRSVLANGAVLAEAGEFTKRAFLNGKMDLTEAEAVADMILAKSSQALDAAHTQMNGALSREIQQQKEKLLNLAGHLAAWADYPEEDIPEILPENVLKTLSEVSNKLQSLLAGYDTGMLLKEGVDTVIVGKPNVGKSTLMNLLAGAPRSIVTDIAGTTRDVIEETVNLNGLLLRLSDTAGIHLAKDVVEEMGVRLAKERLNSAALVLAVFDASEELSEEDKKLMEALKDRPVVAVINKTDLPQKLDTKKLSCHFDTVLSLSAIDPVSLSKLERAIRQKVHLLDVDTSAPMLATERQRECAVRAENAVEEAISAIKSGITMDAVTVSVEEAIDALLELFGGKTSEAVVDHVFSQFCVGK